MKDCPFSFASLVCASLHLAGNGKCNVHVTPLATTSAYMITVLWIFRVRTYLFGHSVCIFFWISLYQKWKIPVILEMLAIQNVLKQKI